MKTVLITGGTSGIGKAIASLFCQHQYRVIVVGRDSDRGHNCVTELARTAGVVRFVQADVSRSTDIEQLFRVVRDDGGHLDVLVNNAGGSRGRDNFYMAREEDLIRGFSTNFFSAFLCSQRAVGLMRHGAIVNVGSVCGHLATPAGEADQVPIYAASKAAIHNLTQNLARLLAPRIRVNAVVPGYTKTPLWGTALTTTEEKRLSEHTRIKRFCTAEEVAQTVYLLATNEAMTGTQVIVDGGLIVGGP